MSILSITIDARAADAIRGADYGAPVTITPLPVGTAWVAAGDATLLAIWHLDPGGFWNVLRNGELSARTLQLTGISSWSYLIVSGDLDLLPSQGWLAASCCALASVQEAGVTVLRCGAVTDVPALLVQLANRHRTPKRLRPPRDVAFVDPGEDMLLALPGIGPATLEKLLAYCGTAGNAIAALTQPGPIPGVPRPVQRTARQALGLEASVALDLTIYDEPQEESHATDPRPNEPAGRARGRQPAAAAVDGHTGAD